MARVFYLIGSDGQIVTGGGYSLEGKKVQEGLTRVPTQHEMVETLFKILSDAPSASQESTKSKRRA